MRQRSELFDPVVELSPSAAPDEATPPFASSLEHLLAHLERVDLLVRAQVSRVRQAVGDDAFRGLTISEAEVDALLQRPLGRPPWAAVPPVSEQVEAALARMAGEIKHRAAESARRGIPLRFATLAARFGLDRFEQDVLLLALAPELDLKYERLYAYLNDDINRKGLTVDLALALLCPDFASRVASRQQFSAGAPLVRHQLIQLQEPPDRQSSLLTAGLKVDERIAGFLQGSDELDPRLVGQARVVVPEARLEALLLPPSLKEGLLRFVVDAGQAQGAAPIVYLQGAYGSGKRSMAEALCRELGAELLAVDGAALLALGEDSLRKALRLCAREALLRNAAIHWENGSALLEGERPATRAALLGVLMEHPGLMFLSGAGPWEPAGALGQRAFVRAELPRPSAAEQMALWAGALGSARPPEGELAVLTGRFRLTAGQIRDAAAAARSLARFRDPEGGQVTLADVSHACRTQHTRKLTALARKVTSHQGWDDLVLSPDRKEQLRELCLHLKHRSRVHGTFGFEHTLSLGKGLSALFAGPPGTGKTMAAGVIARELGLDLYQIDLSRVVSKYIGETEKHLAQIFADAEAANAALFFDEADAIFGRRTEVRDSHDRYANLDTSYLLQQIDVYEGVVILASNFTRNIDEAFQRRMSFSIEFPFPGPAERLRIWQRIWPTQAPRDADLDLELLARKLEVSGGHIRNIAVAAAFLAAEEDTPIAMRHLIHAARRELQKMGKVVDESAWSLSAAVERRSGR